MNSAILMKQARKAAGMTVRQMADALEITVQFIYDIENGRRNIPEQMIERMPPVAREIVASAFAKMHQERAAKLKSLTTED